MTAGPDRLVLALVLPDGGRQLVVIDLATGARLGTIELHQRSLKSRFGLVRGSEAAVISLHRRNCGSAGLIPPRRNMPP